MASGHLDILHRENGVSNANVCCMQSSEEFNRFQKKKNLVFTYMQVMLGIAV